MSDAEEDNARSPSGDEEGSVAQQIFRFPGHPEQWLRYTAPERALAASLDDQQASDLSLHLYNAHALKAKLYDLEEQPKAWQSKESWFGKNADQWRPSHRWTAWPITDVPRPTESFRNLAFSQDPETGPETYRCHAWLPGDELEAQLTATLLRQAKTQAQAAGEPLDHFLVDEEDIGRLTQPLIRGIMGKLDCLLSALHHSRRGQIAQFEEIGQSDTDSATDQSDHHDEQPHTSDQQRLGLPRGLRSRDWSEVLAIAAMIGWDDAVVQSTSHRCSDLFREKMRFTTFRAASPERPHAVSTEQLAEDRSPKQNKKAHKSQAKTICCSLEPCDDKPFESIKRYNEHLRRKHKLSNEDIAKRAEGQKQREEELSSSAAVDPSNAVSKAGEVNFDWALFKQRQQWEREKRGSGRKSRVNE